MKITLKDLNKKGFAVLHGKWGGSDIPHTIIGLNGSQKKAKYMIGYLAYPNVRLKNIIADKQFFGYKKLIRQKELPVLQKSSRFGRWTIDCPPSDDCEFFKTTGRLEQSVTKSGYIKKIKLIKDLLARGEMYQMCYCIRFRKRFEGSPYALFQKLIAANPTDYSTYLNCGDFQIISNSPEHFFKVQNGIITTNPIKGTARKSGNSQFPIPNSQLKQNYDDKNLINFLKSEKERAELDMITDLERNDIGKICEYGTLKLKKERAILELGNLWHTYSEVEGKLRSNVTPEDVIVAMFPGGSITGCPKKRAMEYISKFEGLPRNIFTGSIGYIYNCRDNGWDNRRDNCLHNSPHDCPINSCSMDFNIAIRTALVKDGMLEFWAGGGIVADSDPEKEYEECHLKAERFLDIIK